VPPIRWSTSFFRSLSNRKGLRSPCLQNPIRNTVIIDDCVYKLYFFNTHKNLQIDSLPAEVFTVVLLLADVGGCKATQSYVAWDAM